METLGLSLPIVIALVFMLFRFSKALSSVASVIDDKINATAIEMKVSTSKEIAELEITAEEIQKAQENITLVKSIKF